MGDAMVTTSTRPHSKVCFNWLTGLNRQSKKRQAKSLADMFPYRKNSHHPSCASSSIQNEAILWWTPQLGTLKSDPRLPCWGSGIQCCAHPSRVWHVSFRLPLSRAKRPIHRKVTQSIAPRRIKARQAFFCLSRAIAADCTDTSRHFHTRLQLLSTLRGRGRKRKKARTIAEETLLDIPDEFCC